MDWIYTNDRKPVMEYENYKAAYPNSDFETLVVIKGGLESTILTFDGEAWYDKTADGGHTYYDVSAWMPKPKPPIPQPKPCPFCGCKHPYMKEDSNPNGKFYRIICPDCLAFTRFARTKEEAAELWNRRAE